MTRQEAYRLLGLEPGATMDAIKGAYRSRSKATHPDMVGVQHQAEFQRVQAARDTLLGSQLTATKTLHGASDQGDGHGDGAGPDPVAFVRAFMARETVDILFDGTIRVGTGPRMAYSPADVDAWLASTPIVPLEWLRTMVMLEVRRARVALNAGDIRCAITKIVWDDQQDRRNYVVRPFVTESPDPALVKRAGAVWTRLVSTTIDIAPGLGIAVLQHFIWQVKQKLLNRPVHHHLMPIVISPMQGGGKSTLVGRFLGPLQELATDPISLAEFADSRNADLYRFPVVFIDDVDPVDRAAVPALKRLMTNPAVRGRTLSTSRSDRRAQLSTLIGTANESIGALIGDPTGHRRFIALPFRNGAVAKGGDPEVWRTVNETDYALLWHSVDAFGRSPILPFLADLSAAQATQAPVDPLREWLCAQDFTADAFADIRPRYGLRADELRLRYNAETGEHLSPNSFESRIGDLIQEGSVSLEAKVRNRDGTFYPLKCGRPMQ